MYLVSIDVTFLENAPFSQSPIHISKGEDDDLLVYTIASPSLATVSAPVKPPITQVYTQRQNPPASSPTSAASTSNPVPVMIFLLLFVKVNVNVLI